MDRPSEFWSNSWQDVKSLDEIYKSYGGKSVIWCLQKFLKYERKEAVLDIGCGAGFYFRSLKELGYKELYGLEYDKENIKKAKYLNRKIAGLNIIEGDIRYVPEIFEENYFDAVMSLGLVEHFIYPIDIIRRLIKIVKKGGLLILEMPNFRNCFFYHYNLRRRERLPFQLWWGVKEWRGILKEMANCELEEIQTIDIYGYFHYIPRVLNKVSGKLVNLEIDIENRLFKNSGSLAFYKLRKN